MRLSLLTFSFISALALPSVAFAQNFTDALTMAYQQNPELAAAQAQLRAVDTTVPEAQSGWRPTAEANGYYGYGSTQTGGQEGTNHPASVTASVTQPIFRGGRTVAATGVAKNNVLSQRAALHNTEQTVLLNAATAYLDVLRDQAVLDLNGNNSTVLGRQLKASKNRFEVGEITKTDVSQSESRLARADADRLQAEGNLNVTRATFARLIGQPPVNLQNPEISLPLPANLDEVISKAEKKNPRVVAADYAERASMDNIRLNRGNLLPEVGVTADATRSWDQAVGGSGNSTRIDQERVIGTVRIPLYTAGADYARVSGARETATQRKLEYDNARRLAREEAISAWSTLQAARAGLEAREAQVRAAELSANGVRQENSVGSRTTLDVLNAEQELLDANVARIQAERDLKVAKLRVMAAIGELIPANLQIPGPYYDPVEHYEDVDGAWFGG